MHWIYLNSSYSSGSVCIWNPSASIGSNNISCAICCLFFLEVFATLDHWKNQTKKQKIIIPCHLSSFASDPLHGSKLFLFVFLVFSRFLGEIVTLTNINWQSFHPCTFTLMSSLSYWLWLLGHQRKRNGKHLHHPPLQVSALHCIDVVFLVCRRFGSSSLEVWLMFFEAAISI